jgi:hypothetical protein
MPQPSTLQHGNTVQYHAPPSPNTGVVGERTFESRESDGGPRPAPRKRLPPAPGGTSPLLSARHPDTAKRSVARPDTMDGYPEALNPFADDVDDTAIAVPGARTIPAPRKPGAAKSAAMPQTAVAPAVSHVDAAGHPVAPAVCADDPPPYSAIGNTAARQVIPTAPADSDSESGYSTIDEPRHIDDGGPLPSMTMPAWAVEAEDVHATLDRLRNAIEAAAALTPPAGRGNSRRPAATLHARCMDLHKLLMLGALGRGEPDLAHVAKALVALGQHAIADGYEALEEPLVRRTLALHSHPLNALLSLARLADGNDGTRRALVQHMARQLGADKRRVTPQVKLAQRRLDVAEGLLATIGELAREHATAISWDRQVAAAIDAARKGRPQEIDAALRDMWSGDAALAESDRPRIERLVGCINRLPAYQRQQLAKMLGFGPDAGALARNFARFESSGMSVVEYDTAMRHQMRKYLTHLRAAMAIAMGSHDGMAGLAPPSHGAAAGPGRSTFPPRILRHPTLGASLRRLLPAFLSRRHTRKMLKNQVQIAIARLLREGTLAETSQELHQAISGIDAKLGAPGGASVRRLRIQKCLGELDPAQLSALQSKVTQLLAHSPADTLGQDDPVRRFHGELARGLEREPGIRQCAAALADLSTALRHHRRPQPLLNALDALAEAECQLADPQSEVDFYEDALRRLDPAVKRQIHKHLNGRKGIAPYVQAIDVLTFALPSAWLRYRKHQLYTLARAASS